MKQPDKTARDDPGQSKRFEEAAKQLGIEGDSGAFDRAMGIIKSGRLKGAKKATQKIATPKKTRKKPTK